MVKDLQYFLDEENKFCNDHPNYGQVFYDNTIGEFSEYGINDRLNFLSERIISKEKEYIKKPLDKEQFGLSDAQKVLLHLLYGKYSYIFRDDYYVDITDFVQNLFDTLDDLVNKAPINSDAILYRFCNEHDRSDMKIGDVFTVPHNLTCTNYDWEQENRKNVYIITPLKDNKTRAHNLFEICKHGDENQINFLRNTKFRVKDIKNTEGTIYKKFYLEEVESVNSFQ